MFLSEGGTTIIDFQNYPFRKEDIAQRKLNTRIGSIPLLLRITYGLAGEVKEYIPEYSIVIGNPSQIVYNRKKYPNFDHKKDIGIFP